MKNKKIAKLSIFMLSLTFFMMVDTKYHRALGDYILEFIGLESWTGNQGGFHLTIVYFGILFFMSLYFVGKYAIEKEKISSMKIFIFFVIIVYMIYTTTAFMAKSIKRNSEGLYSIAYLSENSELEYRSIENKITEFNASFTLENYSKKSKTFNISIDSPWVRRNGISPIEIYDLNGSKVSFYLMGNERRTFHINLEKYKINGGMRFSSGGFRGDISEIVLSNDDNEKVYLKGDGFFLIKAKE